MKTTTFDAAELGLLERDSFALEHHSTAARTVGDVFTQIEKVTTNSFIVIKESEEAISVTTHETLRAALRAL